MTLREKLKMAAQLIEDVEQHLDGRSHTCATCGRTVRENWIEWQQRENLQGARRQLNRVLNGHRLEPEGQRGEG